MGHLAGKRCGRAGCACGGLSLACVLLLMLVLTIMPVLPELVGHCQGDRKGRPYYTPACQVDPWYSRGDPRGRPSAPTSGLNEGSPHQPRPGANLVLRRHDLRGRIRLTVGLTL